MFTLSLLEHVFIKEGAPVGIVMHVHDKSFALAAFREGPLLYYVFFDSHGKESGFGERTNAYTIVTSDRVKLAKFLSGLIPRWKFNDTNYSYEERMIIEAEYKEKVRVQGVNSR